MKKSAGSSIIVTSALPYANGPIHVGHLVEYIQTDIYVRFLKLTGENALYCCADDTHGTPIQILAEKEGILPEQLIQKYHQEHLRDFTSFSIEFDSYYSTNSKENRLFSDLFFERLKRKNLIYTKEVELSYCSRCKRFLPDRYIKGKCPKCNAPDQYGDVCEQCNSTHATTDLVDPYSVVCGTPPAKRRSSHYFFRLSSFAGFLKKWFASNKSLQPEIKHYLENWIKEGLQDWDISRDGPYFGFKIPGEEDKYYYVWLDAPIGYISSFTHAIKGDIKKGESRWNDSRITHFIGKDIIYFHFLFWPAMLEAAGFRLPETIVVHGFLTVNGEKMSKSRGTFFTAEEFASKYPPEFLRFYYAKSLSKKLADINLDFKDFHEAVNNELVGNIANYCYRALSFTNKFLNSEVGEKVREPKLEKEILEKVEIIKKAYGTLNFNEAVKEILAIADLGNQYFQKNEPWKLVKQNKASAQKAVTLSLNIVKILSILISPILPNFAKELQSQLDADGEKPAWKNINFNFENKTVGEAKIVLNKIEEKSKKNKFPLNLKVGKILEAKDHPNAEKLYILQVDLGNEKRQLVAGLKGHYQKEALLNKKIIVVANLKPAKLRDILSSGMLLAADDGTTVEVLEPEGSPGDKVTCGDAENNTETITFEDFMKLTIVVKDHHVVCDGKPLDVKGKLVNVNKTGDRAKVR